MNLAIVHHHLNRGGVTQVILNHLRSLHEAGLSENFERIVVFYGGRSTGWPTQSEPALARVEREVVPSIDYDTVVSVSPDAPYREMTAALQRLELLPETTLLHVHNHTLGKNVAWPHALNQLATDGYRMLLQLHDFAEDFRPENYRRQVAYYADQDCGMQEVYFQAPHVHYAVLNSRDRGILLQAGMEEGRLAWLPNPVQPFPQLPHRVDARKKLREIFHVPEQDRYVVYPVRGIRRKNVGELVLWSALCPRPATFGITLAPVNPAERTSYEAWKTLAEEKKLPCKFDVGGEEGLTFHENLAAADAIINTSVAEGFGLVFLEAWLTDNLLIGRDLPEISADFKAAGLRLDSLAPALWIPRRSPIDGHELFSETNYRAKMLELFGDVLKDFGQDASELETAAQQLDQRLSEEWIDFALLTTAAQREVIDSVVRSKDLAEAIVDANEQVMRPLREPNANFSATIEANAKVVLARFSLRDTGLRLRDQYARLMPQAPGPVSRFETAGDILRQFVDLSRFHPVRLESS
ncbi:hypothetical protein [Blastopirellula marina]|uniref:Glycosyltransferase subfamily 4-like N-terminal domain-containing protein n=1 Tax=Blastopirellula marina TaxID=124 RepID=A0A2S8FN07_9BACT|nr:hypothetical protein [Blastopirellula marina]PQO33576.1 hypothetical protein C5Y98_15150 [Blastopirellula marina]PTL43363.1 hypothetical protein C5Y97_15160 [Blastopirellula marina]